MTEAVRNRTGGRILPAVLALAASALLGLLLAPPAQAGKSIDSLWPSGGKGPGTDQLGSADGIAVHESTGFAYVLDTGNRRVVRFDADGTFERAWGGGVVATGPGNVPQDPEQEIRIRATGGTYLLGLPGNGGPGVDEKQIVGFTATGGTFKLTYGGSETASLPFNASAANVQAALEGLDAIGAGDVTVSGPAGGGDWVIEFGGALAETDVPQVGIAPSLTGLTRLSGESVVDVTDPIAHDASPAVVQAALEATDPLAPGEVIVDSLITDFGIYDRAYRVTFGGPFADKRLRELAIGRRLTGPVVDGDAQVIRPGAAAAEICVPADGDVCAAGTSSGEAGHFGEGYGGIAVDQQSGDVYVADGSGGYRVQKFDAAGAFERAWGRDVVRAGGVGDSPVAEQQGIVYSASRPAPTSGTFKLGFANETTAPIAFDAPTTGVGSVQEALLALAAIDPGDIAVTGSAGDWKITFSGAYADYDPPQIEVDGSGLTVGSGLNNFTPVPHDAAAEVCTIATDCKVGREAPQTFLDVARGGEFGPGSGDIGRNVVAVDSQGRVYVGDGGSRVQRFDSDGNFQRAWGEDVIQPGRPGDLGTKPNFKDPGPFEICTVALDCQDGKITGGGPGLFREASAIAVDSADRVYVVDADPDHVHRFAADGSGREFFADAALGASSLPPSEDLLGIAVDPTTDGVFVSTIAANGERVIREVGTDGALVEDHGVGADIPRPAGLASHELEGGRLYASLGSGPLSGTVIVLDDDGGATPPEVTIEPPTGVGSHTATLRGTVDPNGVATTYAFELSSDGGANWSSVPSPPLADPDGDDPEQVEVEATGLVPDTSYLVRLRAQAQLVGSVVSTTESFTTDSELPEAITLPANRIGDTSAALRGMVNPANAATTYYFEYGESTAYGSRIPVPDGELPASGDLRPVPAEVLEGLAPDTEYHYRLVATNPLGTAFGDDVTFRTLPPLPIEAARVPEMVTPPFKVTRAVSKPSGALGITANPGIPSLDGERVLWNTAFFPLSDDQEFPFDGDRVLLSRTSAPSWKSESLITLSLLPGYTARNRVSGWLANSADFLTQAWFFGNPILPNEGEKPLMFYTRRAGTGTAGFTGWLDNVDTQHSGEPFELGSVEIAAVNDDGSMMARSGPYRGLGGAGDPSDEQQRPGFEGGFSVYRQSGPPTGPKDLVNECTGSTAADGTEVPARVGSGAASDVIGSRDCMEGEVVSDRGALLGTASGTPHTLVGPAATAMSDDGRRIFFTSPDPFAAGLPVGCAAATGADTDCPPQLYLRQYAEDGTPTVRWISRSRSAALGDGRYGGAMIAGQRVALIGAGAGFLGASRDGRVVYFKTNAPLTPDDPNGGQSILTGTASAVSWDLYRYEVPPSGDPGDGALTRISGGPDGTADPSTNANSLAGAGPGSGASARFVSDDGSRVYFVTTSALAGADEEPPLAGTSTPGGAPGNGATANLYLFDANRAGDERYRFIGRLPTTGIDVCATLNGPTGPAFAEQGPTGGREVTPSRNNCFRATADGRVAAFSTTARLTADDVDDVSDVYVYDARGDELIRVTAPPEGVPPGSNGFPAGTPSNVILGNGDLGQEVTRGITFGSYDTARGWGGGRTYNFAVDGLGRVSLFFESRLSLVPEDTNGSFWDTYRWREGQLSLVSSGDTENHAYYSGNSTDGEDAFVFTSERIDPREIDDADYDIYDYRIGGGIPYTAPPPPCDPLALQCEDDATAPPPVRGTETAAPTTGNVRPRPRRCRKGKVRRRGKCVPKRRAAHAKRKRSSR